jgi:hypothetical protein
MNHRQAKRAGMIRRACAAAAIAASALVLPVAQAPAATHTFRSTADASIDRTRPDVSLGRKPWLRIAGDTRWRTLVRFNVRDLDGPVLSAHVVLRGEQRTWTPRLRVQLARRHWYEQRVTARRAKHLRVAELVTSTRRDGRRTSRVVIDVSKAVRGGGTVALMLSTPNKRGLRFHSREDRDLAPVIVVQTGADQRRTLKPVAPSTQAPSSGGAQRPPMPALFPVPGDSGERPAAPPARPVAGLWRSAEELAGLPAGGPAWNAMVAAAGAGGFERVSDQSSNHDVSTLAAALVAVRTGDPAYRDRAVAGIAAAIGTESGGRTLALGRNLPSYVIAADILGLASLDPDLDARFRGWLTSVRSRPLDGDTLISIHERRPNNWGTMAGAARIAADIYIGDTADLGRAAAVFRGWLGDRSSYTGFEFQNLSYQADPARPVGINAAGATKSGVSIDGALPDDMRRGCSFRTVPCHTVYPWEALQGAVVQAELLARRGFDAWNWSDQALLRAAAYLRGLDALYGGWWAEEDDTWQPWLLNRAYHTELPATSPTMPGKVMGWTDWSHSG